MHAPLRRLRPAARAAFIGTSTNAPCRIDSFRDRTNALGHVQVIAHRGASGYVPDHTIAAYERGFAVGADWIELDCHCTKDGRLVINHDIELSETTNVAKVFPGRSREVHSPSDDGDPEHFDGWVIQDFTLEELKQLRVRMRSAKRSMESDDKYEIPTICEVCERMQEMREAASSGRRWKPAEWETARSEFVLSTGESRANPNCGLYIETKRPSWHRSIGLPLEEKLVEEVERSGFDGPVIVQSFEQESLERIRELKPEWTRVRLLTADHVPRDVKDRPAHEALMRDIAGYAHGVGPWKTSIVPDPYDPPSRSRLIEAAHDEGLVVHPYTFRSDVLDLHKTYGGNAAMEFWRFFLLGIDGCFTDFPSHAVFAREFYNKMLEETHDGRPPPYLRDYLQGNIGDDL
jgi:glycerophosphoryl diester phosphodiesterase